MSGRFFNEATRKAFYGLCGHQLTNEIIEKHATLKEAFDELYPIGFEAMTPQDIDTIEWDQVQKEWDKRKD